MEELLKYLLFFILGWWFCKLNNRDIEGLTCGNKDYDEDGVEENSCNCKCKSGYSGDNCSVTGTTDCGTPSYTRLTHDLRTEQLGLPVVASTDVLGTGQNPYFDICSTREAGSNTAITNMCNINDTFNCWLETYGKNPISESATCTCLPPLFPCATPTQPGEHCNGNGTYNSTDKTCSCKEGVKGTCCGG